MELKAQLERERSLRILFEEKVQRLESLYSVTADKLQDSLSSEQITLQYHKDEVRNDNTNKRLAQSGDGEGRGFEVVENNEESFSYWNLVLQEHIKGLNPTNQ